MERKPNRFAAAALLSLAMLIAYPLSVGPAALLQACVRSDRLNDAIATTYAPFDLLPDSLQFRLAKWASLWLRLVPDKSGCKMEIESVTAS